MTSAGNRLVESRVVTDLTPVLTKLFEDELTGQLVVEPADSLVLESEQGCEITLVEGIPRAARGVDSGRAGNTALESVGTLGPFHIEVYTMDDLEWEQSAVIGPERPAELLGGDTALVKAIRETSPEQIEDSSGTDGLADFLADTDRIESIRSEARREAQQRAAEWGFDDVADTPD